MDSRWRPRIYCLYCFKRLTDWTNYLLWYDQAEREREKKNSYCEQLDFSVLLAHIIDLDLPLPHKAAANRFKDRN